MVPSKRFRILSRRAAASIACSSHRNAVWELFCKFGSYCLIGYQGPAQAGPFCTVAPTFHSASRRSGGRTCNAVTVSKYVRHKMSHTLFICTRVLLMILPLHLRYVRRITASNSELIMLRTAAKHRGWLFGGPCLKRWMGRF